ncbi:vacuolar ATPase assembly integral membrane protein vma21-like [Amblyomma americanum]|uniref:Hypothetical secreted protein 458 n=1 Tax=Amblyomma variegatum TaxID=34610 RepID=F0JA51_AMBVA|nr:TPA_inf: hypothetical secreted protein 458 [Amblyomma variegatum]
MAGPLATLLLYTALMVTLPLGAFFGAQWALAELWHASATACSVGATVASVLCVHLVLGLFVYEAYHEAVPAQDDKSD